MSYSRVFQLSAHWYPLDNLKSSTYLQNLFADQICLQTEGFKWLKNLVVNFLVPSSLNGNHCQQHRENYDQVFRVRLKF